MHVNNYFEFINLYVYLIYIEICIINYVLNISLVFIFSFILVFVKFCTFKYYLLHEILKKVIYNLKYACNEL